MISLKQNFHFKLFKTKCLKQKVNSPPGEIRVMAFCFPAYRCSNGEWSNGVNGAMDFSEYKVRFSKRFLYRGILISRADILLKQVHRGRRRKTSTLKL